MIGGEYMLVNKRSILKILFIAMIAALFIIFVYKVVFDNESKSRIINLFENNSDKFILIQKYAEETEGDLFVEFSFMKVEIGNIGGSDEILDEKVKEAVLFVTKNLGFKSVYETDSYIIFRKSRDANPGGIIYLENSSIPAFAMENEKISGKWHYYMTRNI